MVTYRAVEGVDTVLIKYIDNEFAGYVFVDDLISSCGK